MAGEPHGFVADGICWPTVEHYFQARKLPDFPYKENEMPQEANYDEAKVPAYVLPDPLKAGDGSPVRDAADWTARRRPELLRLFEEEVYGRVPGHPEEMTFATSGPAGPALGGLAVRKQVTVLLTENGITVPVEVLIYLPAHRHGRVPLFLGLNFYGNHTIQDDPGIKLPSSWLPDRPELGIAGHRATEAGRGKAASRWPVPRILGRGFGVATAYCGDLDPDFDDGFANGVHPLFYRAGQRCPDPTEWGTIGAWAWGLSRILDYLETDPEVDPGRVVVLGHSRLGKTALWAGARDPRFAAAISNNSGCGGAALSRRGVGETVARINAAFPHWFCARFRRYDDHEERLPVDQHELLALVAPRPVYVASASEDLWADPRGEFLSAFHADPVYRLLGVEGMAAKEMPGIEEPVTSRVGYHLRRGPHDVTDYDWDRYMDFAERHVGG